MPAQTVVDHLKASILASIDEEIRESDASDEGDQCLIDQMKRSKTEVQEMTTAEALLNWVAGWFDDMDMVVDMTAKCLDDYARIEQVRYLQIRKAITEGG